MHLSCDAGQLSLQEGRKYLKTVSRDGSTGQDIDTTIKDVNENSTKRSILHPKLFALAIPAFFILCCAFVCPCFQARKRDTGHAVLSKELNSSE